MTSAKNFYSKSELAKKLGVAVRTLDNWISNGKISFTKIGRRIIFSESDLDQLLENNRCEAFYYGKEFDSRLPELNDFKQSNKYR